jgi:hypothetical protein
MQTHDGLESTISDEKRCRGFKPSMSSTIPGINPLKSDPNSEMAEGNAAAPEDMLLM